MLTIKTDLQDIRWLRYILDEFTATNSAQFEIRILAIDSLQPAPFTLYYSATHQYGPTIYSHPKPFLSENIEYLDNDLFILKGSSGTGNFSLTYDLFWNAFVFLSRYEEYNAEQQGRKIRSYSINHPRYDKKSFESPVVNKLFNELERMIKKLFPTLIFGIQTQPIIELSHDVDYIKKTFQLRIKQTLFNGFNLIRSFNKPHLLWQNISKMCSFLFSNPSYWCFEYWQELEKKRGLRSTFYIYVKSGDKNWISWLIDPSYNLSEETMLQKKLKSLIEDGFVIGLHGSYQSALCKEQLQQEKELLETILQKNIVKTRQHWLNYTETITPYIHEALFEVDSTIGWNDRMGFRSGIASSYHPYDHIHQRAMQYKIVPQVVMDSHLFDYGESEDMLPHAREILTRGKIHSKHTHISISWHQRVCSSNYRWHKSYEELLDVI